MQHTKDEARALLRQNTEQAMAAGACGLPWFTAYNAQGERDDFWGFDHLGQVITFLGLEKLPLPHL
jgi:2-hydroxychromene-2-carboxylate isomerase